MHRATPSVDGRDGAVAAAVSSIVLTVLAITGVARVREPTTRPETTVQSTDSAATPPATATATDRGGASA